MCGENLMEGAWFWKAPIGWTYYLVQWVTPHRRYYLYCVLTFMHLAHRFYVPSTSLHSSAPPFLPTYIIPTYIQNGWNVLHHTCASDEKSYNILHWLLEEFTHCDLLRTRVFLNQVEQVRLYALCLFFPSPSFSASLNYTPDSSIFK